MEKLRIIFSILTLSAVLSGCSQNVIVSDSMDSWSDSSIVSKTAEEGEIVLEKGGYLWNQAEKSREEFYNSVEDNEERQLWEDAVARVQQYLVPGEFLDISWSEKRDDTFPQSGSAVLNCTRWSPNGNFLFFNIWITVKEDQETVCSNNYLNELFRQYAYTREVKTSSPEVRISYRVSDYIDSYASDLLIIYENPGDLPKCLESFSSACLELKEFFTVLPQEISLNVRFVQGDSETGMLYFYNYYPVHTINFSSLTKESLRELSDQVQSENLSVMKTLRPKLYQSVQTGGKAAWADYIQPYRTPGFTYCTVYMGLPESYWSWSYREAHQNSVMEYDEFYKQYREQLEENGGAVSAFTSESYQKFSFISSDSVRTRFADHMFQGGSAISTDMYTIRKPYGFLYAYEESVSMDMILPDLRKSPRQDMEIPEIREADRGRFYLLFLRRAAGEEDSLEELLKQERVNARLAPILREDVLWEETGSHQSDYHKFEYAKGETGLRYTSVYMPQMERDENFVYLLVFEEFKDSEVSQSLYKMREQMVDTFVMLPYRYQCRKGDTLERISRLYTGSGKHVLDLCNNPLNQITDPDLILEDAYIEIPLDLLLERSVY